MVSAHLRYITLGLAAVVFVTMGCAYVAAGQVWPGAVGCLLLAGFCAEGASYVRRSAVRLQERHRQAQQQVLAEIEAATFTEPWSAWCCERGFLTRGDLHHPTHCTKETTR